MNCADFKEQAAALALGALDAGEQAACEAHLDERRPHDGCFETLERARATASMLSLALPPVPPGPHVWAAIEARLDEKRRASGTRRRIPRWMAFAAAAVLVLLLLVERRGQRTREDLAAKLAAAEQGGDGARHRAAQLQQALDAQRTACEREVAALRGQAEARAAAVALLRLPSTRVVTLAAQGGRSGHATALVNLVERRAVVVAGGLAEAPGDYELWVIRGPRKLPAGLLSRGPDGAISLVDPALLAGGIDALAVTLEPAGGGPQPTGPVVLVGAMPRG